MPFWRFVLYQRYIGKHKPEGLSSLWTNYGKLHSSYPSLPVEDCSPTPCNLFQSSLTIKTTPDDVQLLKVHVFVSTCTILVQGRSCIEWVDEEFARLRAIVHTLAASSTNADRFAICSAQKPDTVTAKAILAPASLSYPSLSNTFERGKQTVTSFQGMC